MGERLPDESVGAVRMVYVNEAVTGDLSAGGDFPGGTGDGFSFGIGVLSAENGPGRMGGQPGAAASVTCRGSESLFSGLVLHRLRGGW